jgi:predicted RecB family nuclease
VLFVPFCPCLPAGRFVFQKKIDKLIGMEIARHFLSKSTFMYGCQCPKRLWLHKYMPELKDEETEQQAAIFQRGTDVGLLAQQLFPGGINAAPDTHFEYQKSVAATAAYINEGHQVIYEAAFQFDGVLCAVDILIKKNGKWYAYEVKSTTSVKEPFLVDAALQYQVLSNSGIQLQDFYIMHLDSSYIRYGELEINKLFKAVSVKKDIIKMQEEISLKLVELKNVLQLKESPEKETGTHCNKPYPCDFIGHCHKDLPEDPPEDEYINDIAIRDFLKPIAYPIYYLDFETWMTAVPECDGHWSYRQVPFQYSLHIQEAAGEELKHYAYLATHPHDSLEDFTDHLLANLGTKGPIIVYNKTFENTILKQLAQQFPKKKKQIAKIQARLYDLMSPFRSNYRLPAMQGSYSIKYVLPALVPELSYSTLTISNGADASSIFYNLKDNTNEEEVVEIRNNLHEYCKMDTLAMVRILKKLKQINNGI